MYRYNTSKIVNNYVYSSKVFPVPSDYDIIELPTFKKECKKLKLNKDDIAELKEAIKLKPAEADLGFNIYKFRWSPSKWHTGKSNATRTLYIELIEDSKVYLVSIYKKSKKDNISQSRLNDIKKLSEDLKKGD